MNEASGSYVIAVLEGEDSEEFSDTQRAALGTGLLDSYDDLERELASAAGRGLSNGQILACAAAGAVAAVLATIGDPTHGQPLAGQAAAPGASPLQGMLNKLQIGDADAAVKHASKLIPAAAGSPALASVLHAPLRAVVSAAAGENLILTDSLPQALSGVAGLAAGGSFDIADMVTAGPLKFMVKRGCAAWGFAPGSREYYQAHFIALSTNAGVSMLGNPNPITLGMAAYYGIRVVMMDQKTARLVRETARVYSEQLIASMTELEQRMARTAWARRLLEDISPINPNTSFQDL